ncbi:unnamed protein product, partial [Prorocentrum cordatum]
MPRGRRGAPGARRRAGGHLRRAAAAGQGCDARAPAAGAAARARAPGAAAGRARGRGPASGAPAPRAGGGGHAGDGGTLHQLPAALGVQFIVASYEADAQLAYLAIEGLVDVVVTADADLLAFGCPRVLFDLDSGGGGLEVRLGDLQGCEGLAPYRLAPASLPDLCILSGCDYLPALPHVGLRTAAKWLHRAGGSVEGALRLAARRGVQVPGDYRRSFARARLVFESQLVFDPRTGRLCALRPLMVAPDVPEGYLGEALDDETARSIACGHLHPVTLESVDPARCQPQVSAALAAKLSLALALLAPDGPGPASSSGRDGGEPADLSGRDAAGPRSTGRVSRSPAPSVAQRQSSAGCGGVTRAAQGGSGGGSPPLPRAPRSSAAPGAPGAEGQPAAPRAHSRGFRPPRPAAPCDRAAAAIVPAPTAEQYGALRGELAEVSERLGELEAALAGHGGASTGQPGRAASPGPSEPADFASTLCEEWPALESKLDEDARSSLFPPTSALVLFRTEAGGGAAGPGRSAHAVFASKPGKEWPLSDVS